MKKLYKIFSSFLKKRKLYVVKSLYYDTTSRIITRTDVDYIRVATAELCAREIHRKNINGAVAEVGVFKGDFASVLNQLFPTKTLYLFDTFEGFHQNDAVKEQENKFSTSTQDFSQTSIDLVMKKMPFPYQCEIRKGYFPETINGLEETYCFVSLDADLYQPIYAGLEYFYPRLSKGGYIFIDDYNNEYYKGSKEAVREYCQKNSIAFVPIPDGCGGVVITK